MCTDRYSTPPASSETRVLVFLGECNRVLAGVKEGAGGREDAVAGEDLDTKLEVAAHPQTEPDLGCAEDGAR